MLTRIGLLLTLVFSFSSISQAEPGDVYRQFGEKPGLTKVVNDFVLNLLADKRTEHFFAKVDQVHLKEKLVEQFCDVLEGPCKYSGRKMGESHDGLEIKAADFNALVEDLKLAMTKNKIPERAQNKLLAKLAPMHREIIEK